MTVDYSLKTKRDEFRKSGIFYTPPELGKYMQSFLPPNITEIYDPTCGHGALLELFGPDVKKYGQEINPEAIPTAQALPNSVIVHGDTLTNPAFMDRRFSAIIANPPFSMHWTPVQNDPRFTQAPAPPPASRADYAFILHILYYLADHGTAVTIASGGSLFREQAEGKIRRWMIDQNYVDQVISIPKDTFRDTSIPVVVMVLKKSRPTTDITFSDKATGAKVVVPVAEVIRQRCSLSPGVYLPHEGTPAAPTDWKAKMAESILDTRAKTAESLRLSISTARKLNGVFPHLPPLEPWLDELRSIIDEARPKHEIRLESYPEDK